MSQIIKVQNGIITYSAPPAPSGAYQAVSFTVNGTVYVTDTTDNALIPDTGSLQVKGGASVNKSLYVGNALRVIGNGSFGGTLSSTGNLAVNTNKFTVNALTGNTAVAGTLSSANNFSVNTNKFTVAATTGNTLVAGTLSSAGNLAVNTNKFTVDALTGNTIIAGSLNTTSTLTTTGNIYTSGTLGAAGNFAINTSKFTVDALTGNTYTAGTLTSVGNISTSGTLGSTGNFAVNTNKFTVDALTGNTSIAGTLNVTGTTTFNGAVTFPSGSGFGLDMGGNKVFNLAEPTAPQDAATKNYVDNIAAGVQVHAACDTLTTVALPSCVYNNGVAGLNATLTATTNGALGTIGGYAGLVIGSRILVKDQVAQLQNGIYVVTSLGSGVAPWILTRAADFDGAPTHEIGAGDLTYIQFGTAAGTQWVEINTGSGSNSSIIVGTNPIAFSQFSGPSTYKNGNGISINTSNPSGTSVINNTGVITLLGTTNQITVASTVPAAPGSFTVSLPATISGLTSLTSATFTSTQESGTAPFTVTSTTKVANLNVDRLDDLDSTSFLRSDATDNYTSGTLTFNSGTTLTAAAGATVNFSNTATAPFTVASTTKVTNLNADLLDGYNTSTTAEANRIPVYNGSGNLVGNITGTAANVTINAELTGEATTTGLTNVVTLANSAVIGKVLTGYTSGAGTISAADSILSAIQKLNGNIASTIAGTVSTFSGGTTGLTPAAATTGAVTLGGRLAIANGGTDATTAAQALTNLGATTVGANFAKLANPGAITFPRINADNTVSTLNAATFRTAIGAGTGGGSVTTTSVVSANGFAGSVATATTTPAITVSTTVTGVLKGNGTAISAATAGTDYSAGTSALTTGILKSTTTTGALSIAVAGDFPTLNQNTLGTASNVTGTVEIANGGTGSTTAVSALTALGAAAVGQTMHIGTTAVAINRASGALTLAGLTLTTPVIGVATGTSFNSITGLASINPLAAGTAAVGTATLAARQDHVHPAQTTVSGNAGTATRLTADRTINGVIFNGSDNITIEDATKLPLAGGTLTGALIGTTITASSFNATSTQRVKQAITDLNVSYLDRFDQLKPREYDRTDYAAHEFGFIAEEMAQVYPEVVGRDGAGQPSGIDYGKLSTILTAKVQEQQTVIQKLQSQMAEIMLLVKGLI